MITYVLTISQTFPSHHYKFGEPTDFILKIKHYEKIHTIRDNYQLWEKRFEKIDKGLAQLSVRIWSGIPYQSKQYEIFKYNKLNGIGLQKLCMDKDNKLYVDELQKNSYPIYVKYKDLAVNDGLDIEEFNNWFNLEKLDYDNFKPKAIIHFTDFRYFNYPC